MSLFLKALKAIIWPERCIFCDRVITYNEKSVCKSCESKLPYITGKTCAACGCEKQYCGCGGNIMYYDRFTAPFYYENEVRTSLHDFKFRENDMNAEYYAKYIYDNIRERFADERFDFIASVPMYYKDRRKRGYDQSELLASHLSKRLGVPYRKKLIVKIYPTEKQRDQSYLGRSGNVLGVFDVKENIDGSSVLLIDDIRTTGSTLSECGKMLYLKGAKRVCCAAVAAGKKKKTGE